MRVSVSKGVIRPSSFLVSFYSHRILCCLGPLSGLCAVQCFHGCFRVYHYVLYTDHVCQCYLYQYVYCTCSVGNDDQNNAVSIAWQIYHTRRFMPGGLAALLPVFIVVIESGALYATSVLALLISFLVGSNGEYIMLAIIPPIVVSAMN